MQKMTEQSKTPSHQRVDWWTSTVLPVLDHYIVPALPCLGRLDLCSVVRCQTCTTNKRIITFISYKKRIHCLSGVQDLDRNFISILIIYYRAECEENDPGLAQLVS